MPDRPIIFSAESVSAILEGRKTQTRRLVTVPWQGSRRALPYEPYYVEEDGELMVDCSEADDSHGNGDYREASTCLRCPYGQPGDRLWVRETWRFDGPPGSLPVVRFRSDCTALLIERLGEVASAAYLAWARSGQRGYGRWRSPMFMPRWASRITLEVVEVRVQRLQEITEEDARAEGVDFEATGPDPESPESLVCGFERLWDAINGKRATWASNPWVWAVTFRREEAHQP